MRYDKILDDRYFSNQDIEMKHPTDMSLKLMCRRVTLTCYICISAYSNKTPSKGKRMAVEQLDQKDMGKVLCWFKA
jgi:hypothetical protein